MHQEGDHDAHQQAEEHFHFGMPQQFGQMFVGKPVRLEQFVQHLVQNAGLLAGGPAHALGIEHNDGGKGQGDGKQGIRGTHANGHRGAERRGQRGMGAGHAARADQEAEINFPHANEKANHFRDLRQHPAAED